MAINKYCMVCTILKGSKPYDEKDTKEMYKYEHPKCTWCDNTEHFIEFDETWVRGNNNHFKNIEQFRKDLQDNPFYDPVIAKEAKERFDAVDRRIVSANRARAAAETKANAPKCPTCGSTNIEDISTLERMVSIGVVGLASDKIGKQKRCKNCGYKW